jgi:hypothetical protein
LREIGCDLFEDVGLIALDDLDWYPLVGSGITALAQPTERDWRAVRLSACLSVCAGM